MEQLSSRLSNVLRYQKRSRNYIVGVKKRRKILTCRFTLIAEQWKGASFDESEFDGPSRDLDACTEVVNPVAIDVVNRLVGKADFVAEKSILLTEKDGRSFIMELCITSV